MVKVVIDEPCTNMPIILNYSGPKPDSVYFEMKNAVKRVFAIDDKDIEEREINWDRSSGEEKFSSTFLVTKILDENTHLFVEIKINGSLKYSKEYGTEGKVSILIDPRIKSFANTSFISGILGSRKYLEEKISTYKSNCKDIVNLFVKDLKNFLNIKEL